MNVYEDRVLLPNGETIDYINFGKHHDSTAVIAINEQGFILVQQEVSYPINEWLYQFPGGAVDENESAEQGAVRELIEEAGVTGALEKIGSYYVDNRRREDICHVFVAKNLSFVPAQNEPQEAFIDHWLHPTDVDEMIRSAGVMSSDFLAAWTLYKLAN